MCNFFNYCKHNCHNLYIQLGKLNTNNGISNKYLRGGFKVGAYL